MTHIDEAAKLSYEAGIPAVDFAEGQIVALLRSTRAAVLEQVLATDAAADWFTPDLSDAALARRIIGALMNAGWEMPVWPIPEPHTTGPEATP
jgi:hypothetical protein